MSNNKDQAWIIHSPNFEYLNELNPSEAPWGGHNFFAYDLIVNLKPELLVELGTFKGYSLFSFSQAAKDFNLETRINAIDTWEGDKHAGFFGEELYHIFQKIKAKYYKGVNIIIHKKLFDKAIEDFNDKSIDILHIDGLHTYEAVKHDFNTWLPKVKENGVIMLHDVCEKSDDFGVYKLWIELKTKYKNTITFKYSHGLGVIFLDDKLYEIYADQSEELQRLYKLKFELQDSKAVNRVISKKLKECEQEILEYDKNLKISLEQNKKLQENILEYDQNLKMAISQREDLKQYIEELKKNNGG